MKLCSNCLSNWEMFEFSLGEKTMEYCTMCKDYEIVNKVISVSDKGIVFKKTIELEHPFIDILRKHVNNPYLENYVIDLEEEEFYWLMHGLTS